MLNLELTFSEEYPRVAPHVKFVHLIPFHPNVSPDGEICAKSLLRNWNQQCSVTSIIDWIQSMLDSPCLESPANMLALELFTRNYTEYQRLAENSMKLASYQRTNDLANPE
jgi:ubiquitin-protein ligase